MFKPLRAHRFHPLLVLVLLVGLTQSVYPHEGHQDAEPVPAQPAVLKPGEAVVRIPKESQFLFNIRTALAQERPLARRLNTTGRIVPHPRRIAEVHAPFPGRVTGGPVPLLGQSVARGQVLAVIEQNVSGAERLQLRTELLKTDSQLAQARLDLTLAGQEIQLAQEEAALTRRNLERLQSLEAVVAKKEIPLAQLEHTRALAQIQRARNTRQKSQARLKQLGRERQLYQSLGQGSSLSQSSLRAPISGVISKIHLLQGEQVEPQQQLVEIIDASTVWLEANVHENDLAQVSELQAAEIRSEAYPTTRFHGRLVTLGQRIDEHSHTVKAVFEVANPGNLLRIGMFVAANLATRAQQARLAVPARALYQQGEKTWIFIHTQAEEFAARQVEIEQTASGWAFLRGGIQPGERVVVQGAHQLFMTLNQR